MMSIFHGMNTTASALTAQRLTNGCNFIQYGKCRYDTSKMVDGEWQPYRRKTVTLKPIDGNFSNFLNVAMGKSDNRSVGNGVKVTNIKEDTETPFKLVFDPTHTDANEDGYVEMPNVDPLREMVDLISATRSYEANVTVLNANKAMLSKALEIGK